MTDKYWNIVKTLLLMWEIGCELTSVHDADGGGALESCSPSLEEPALSDSQAMNPETLLEMSAVVAYGAEKVQHGRL